uniref:Uncharacterized protein n=1 Tax=Glossina pallidipes TaxID=7398 RepID=A0A1B0AAQ7_GLOPL
MQILKCIENFFQIRLVVHMHDTGRSERQAREPRFREKCFSILNFEETFYFYLELGMFAANVLTTSTTTTTTTTSTTTTNINFMKKRHTYKKFLITAFVFNYYVVQPKQDFFLIRKL